MKNNLPEFKLSQVSSTKRTKIFLLPLTSKVIRKIPNEWINVDRWIDVDMWIDVEFVEYGKKYFESIEFGWKHCL